MTFETARPFLLLLVGIGFTVSGELMLKRGMTDVGGFDILDPANIVGALFRVFTNPFVFFGFVLIFCGALFWLAVISELPLSVAYPMLAMSYVAVVFLSAFFFQEDLSVLRLAGVGVIIAGVVLVGLSHSTAVQTG